MCPTTLLYEEMAIYVLHLRSHFLSAPRGLVAYPLGAVFANASICSNIVASMVRVGGIYHIGHRKNHHQYDYLKPYKRISRTGILCDPKTVQSVSHLELQVFLTQFSAPNVPSRQIHHPTSKCILMIPSGPTCALHILQHTLKKMVSEKFIKGPQIVVGDVIEFEGISSNIIVASNKRNDYMSALSK